MNHRPYPNADRALAQLERNRVPDPPSPILAFLDELTDWQRKWVSAWAGLAPKPTVPSKPAVGEQPATWTPPPPGDAREQLPDHLLNLISGGMPDYTSTACGTAYVLATAVHWSHPRRAELGQWAARMHARCRLNQKFTGQLCVCGCHDADQPAAGEQRESQEVLPPAEGPEYSCPAFPERCPNLRTVDPRPHEHLGGIRCGCADPQRS